jgi:hypothetical protein
MSLLTISKKRSLLFMLNIVPLFWPIARALGLEKVGMNGLDNRRMAFLLDAIPKV